MIKAIVEMLRPKDAAASQRLNGTVAYLSKFLPHLSEIMEPLRQLARRDPKTDKLVDFVWIDEHEKVFQNIKKVVSNAPVLAYYDPKEELEIQCDASDKGIGAALLQKGFPIAYMSKALTDAET